MTAQPIGQKRIIICGTNGTGKTTFADKAINSILSVAQNKTCLALLPDDGEPLFRQFREILKTQIPQISRGNFQPQKKFKLYFDNRKIFTDLMKFENGVLCLDDGRYYVSSTGEELRPLYIRSRQGNFHILFICHGLSEIPPALFTWSTEMVLFNTTDTWERLKQKIPNPPKFAAIVNDVRARANNHINGCNPRIKCTCGAGYIYKVIDLKRDLL